MLLLRPTGQKYNALQSSKQKTQDPATRILQKTMGESCVLEGWEVYASLIASVM